MYKKIIGLAVLPFLLAGCADNINSDHYNTNQAGKVSTVSQCTVLSVRQVGVNSDSDAGTLIGGIAGGLLGGLVGDAAEKGLSSQTGLEYIVKLDNGQVISVTQGTGQALGVGQRCLVLFGNTTRIIAQ